jgi:hypothetical protein
VAIDVTYRPRNPEDNPLDGVVARHLETFLARQRERDRHVPGFCGARIPRILRLRGLGAGPWRGALFVSTAMPADWTGLFLFLASEGETAWFRDIFSGRDVTWLHKGYLIDWISRSKIRLPLKDQLSRAGSPASQDP